ncbi:MAG: hypothetical protein K0U47_10345 [Epsilonproteobacteria bacterium]|nr:hypothetical protein [Campylobacterota bacterium]
MVKAKQKTLRIFNIEIENEADFFPYMEKNLILLKEYLLVLKGDITPKVTQYLDSHNICFILSDDCKLNFSSKTNNDQNRDIISKSVTEAEPQAQKSTPNQQPIVTIQAEPRVQTLLIEKPIRSGEVVIHEGDVTIFGRVNSAAKVIAEGNVEVYGAIDGLVQCDGDYMIVKELGKGHIIFNGDILEKEHFNGTLKKVTYSSAGAVIKDIF